MKVNAITNYVYSNNICKNNSNNPTFGNISVSKKYINKIRSQCGNKTADKVSEFCRRNINLKELIGYDKLSETRKVLADEYFEVMSPSEVKDLTVRFFVESVDKPYYSNYDGSSRLDKEIVIKLDSKLPMLVYHANYDTIELAKWQPFEARSTVLKSSLYGDATEKELAEEHEDIMQRLNYSIGFKLAGDTWIPIPSENLYNIIANAINNQIDLLEESKDSGRYKAAKTFSKS